MSYEEYKGNLFDSEAQALVNTVNCVGVMGKGVALEFRRRFPTMYESYLMTCQKRLLNPGQILPYKHSKPWILNFAVKNDWKHPSKLEWVESCLDKFRKHYQELGISSAAFPWIGSMNGGLPWEQVHNLIRQYLKDLPHIDIEVIEFDPDAPDPLYRELCKKVFELSQDEFSREANITQRAAQIIFEHSGYATSLTRICEAPGIGKTTADNLYKYLVDSEVASENPQRKLF